MPSADADGAAVASALASAGVAVVSRAFVEDDENALERALGPGDALTVLLAGGGGSAGDIVRRVLARVTGTRLVLNDRVLTALEEWYRRHDRPLPRRAERLGLLPPGAAAGGAADGEGAWGPERSRGTVAGLTRGTGVQTMTTQHLVPLPPASAPRR